MAGLHSGKLINVKQACPGHQSLFPTLFLEGQREECWCQKRQTRRTPSPPHPPGKRRGCLALGLPLCLLEEAGGGRPQVGSAWEAGVRQEPDPDFLRPFGPDAKDGQKQRAVGAQLAWAEPREVLRSIGPVSGTGFSAQGAGRGYQGVSRRHRVAESLTDPAPGRSHVCIPLPPSTPTSPALGFPSRRIPPPAPPTQEHGAQSPGWCALRTLVSASILGRKSQNHCESFRSPPHPGQAL